MNAPDPMPRAIRAAVEALADFAVENLSGENDTPREREQLRAHVSGCIEVAMTDPDWSQVAEVRLDCPTCVGATRTFDDPADCPTCAGARVI